MSCRPQHPLSGPRLRPSWRAARIVIAIVGLIVAAWGFDTAYETPSSGATAAGLSPGARIGPSGLPLPRFVSLRADRVNVRAGPGRSHRVTWTFNREGLPVEVVSEFDNWRRVRDSDGAEGWVFHSLLSGRRTGMVAPWSDESTLVMRRQADESAKVAARIEPGVLVDLEDCDGEWCRVTVQSVTGWLHQNRLWGVYPRETIQ